MEEVELNKINGQRQTERAKTAEVYSQIWSAVHSFNPYMPNGLVHPYHLVHF